ncbi:hypothetical protein CYMTET_43627 [Cymbomonas tetramitiformis]|uniref:Right handed beta helix domain-containing protein n=1 Tax=Cymbomonas tetramitiformis TaxID=36881 RepID=A0AAE0F0F5_9CHLO|nr:hypothetical protein CYMTET_43627 [Cymbomonas tetramitiformis]
MPQAKFQIMLLSLLGSFAPFEADRQVSSDVYEEAALPKLFPERSDGSFLDDSRSTAFVTHIESAFAASRELLASGSDQTTVISNAINATQQLDAAIHSSDVHTVIIQVPDVLLEYELSAVAHNLSIFGDVPGSDGITCTIAPLGRFRLLKVLGAATLALENVRLINGTADAGGGVLVTGATLLMNSCELSQNADVSVGGGGLFILDGRAEVTDTIFAGNVAAGLFGGGAVEVVSSEVEFLRCTFIGNTGVNAGAVGLVGAQKLHSYTAPALRDCLDEALGYNASEELEGSFSGTVSFMDCVLQANTAEVDGGAAMAMSCMDSAEKPAFTFNHTLMVDNVAVERGGAVMLLFDCNMAADNTTVQGNSANLGGGVMVYESHLSISASWVTQNNAESGAGLAVDNGAALLVSGYSAVSHNRAAFFGGGIWCHHNASVNVHASNITHNRALKDGGGVYSNMDCDLELEDALVAANVADVSGAGVFGSASVLTLSGCTVERNVAATGSGGGLAVEHSLGASLVRSSTIRNNSAESDGGGVDVANATVVLEGCTVEENTAEQSGGGLHLGAAANVTFASGSLRSNRAERDGGGAVVGAGGELAMEATEVASNTAASGGGGGIQVALASSQTGNTALRLSANVTLTGNRAPLGYGGAVATDAPYTAWSHSFRWTNLTMRDNVALHGSCLLWEHPPDAAPEELTVPECVECLCEVAGSVMPVMGTTASAFHMHQPEGSVVSSTTTASGEAASPSLTYIATDYYGEVVPSSAAAPHVFVAGEITSGSGRISGGTAQYAAQGAVMSDLVVHAPPGVTVWAEFWPTDASWQPVSLSIEVKACEAGDVYREDHQLCVPCLPGSIKFDNSSELCADCLDVEGIICHGRSSYTLEDGYWMSPAAELCDSTTCVLDLVRQCEVGEACASTAGSRANTDGRKTVAMGELCADGYDPSVVLCGGCSERYNSGILGKCQACATSPALLWLHPILVSLAMIGLMLLLLRVLWRTILARVPGARASALLAGETATLQQDFGDFMHFVGYLHMIGQLQGVFGVRAVPRVLDLFLAPISWLVNLDMFSMLGFRCLSDHYGMGSVSFYHTFGTYALYPACLAVIPLVHNVCNPTHMLQASVLTPAQLDRRLHSRPLKGTKIGNGLRAIRDMVCCCLIYRPEEKPAQSSLVEAGPESKKRRSTFKRDSFINPLMMDDAPTGRKKSVITNKVEEVSNPAYEEYSNPIYNSRLNQKEIKGGRWSMMERDIIFGKKRGFEAAEKKKGGLQNSALGKEMASMFMPEIGENDPGEEETGEEEAGEDESGTDGSNTDESEEFEESGAAFF